MYRDNDTTTLCPQDANSMAILYNLTTSPEQASSVSKGLTKNWNNLGPVAPELPDTISPFIGSLEVSMSSSNVAIFSHVCRSFKRISSLVMMRVLWTSCAGPGDICSIQTSASSQPS